MATRDETVQACTDAIAKLAESIGGSMTPEMVQASGEAARGFAEAQAWLRDPAHARAGH